MRSPIALAVVSALLLASCTGSQAGGKWVTAQGATHTIHDITLTAKSGTVAKKAKLSVLPPKPATKDVPLEGLNKKAIAFDVSLGGAQPKEPLDVTIPLEGVFAPPAGSTAQSALLYTADDKGGFSLLPSRIEYGRLHGVLPHLSAKYVVYANDETLLDKVLDDFILPHGILNARPSDCKDSIITSAGVFELDEPKAWSRNRTSAVHPCLEFNENMLGVRVINNSWPMWSAAGWNARLQEKTEEIETEIVKSLARRMFPDKVTQAYVASGSELYARIMDAGKAASIELRSDPSTFYAGIAWFTLNFLITVLSGKFSLEPAELLANTTSIIDCFQHVVRIPNSKKTTEVIAHFAEVLVSRCSEQIAKQLGSFTSNRKLWNEIVDSTLIYAVALVEGSKTVFSGIDSAWRELSGKIVVVVKPAGVNFCPSDSRIATTVRTQMPTATHGKVDRIEVQSVACQNNWSAVSAYVALADGGGGSLTFLLKLEGSRWILKAAHAQAGMLTGFNETKHCSNLPPKVRMAYKVC